MYDSVNGMLEAMEKPGLTDLYATLDAPNATALLHTRLRTAPAQRCTEVLELYLDAANTRPMATRVVAQISGRPAKAAPPLKALTRILEKAYLRPDAQGDCSRICDVVRDMSAPLTRAAPSTIAAHCLCAAFV